VIQPSGPIRRKTMETTTKRAGQLSVRLLALALSVSAVFLLIGGDASADIPAGPTVEYVVVEGDTLWRIASRQVGAGEDIRPMVERIMVLSGLTSSGLVPGQVLRLPEA
jgi:nucleoid-associated protein YgaU